MFPENRPDQENRERIYEQLREPNEIRVLKLSSGTSLNKEIDCELVLASLCVDQNTSPQLTTIATPSTTTSLTGADNVSTAKPVYIKYEAVSWCWGLDAQTQVIRVKKDGIAYDFRVSPLLEQALKALRLPSVDRYLWIDAICIDQKNLTERNAQVPKMDRIYGNASNVCIWIGPASTDSDEAIEFITSKVLKIWDFDELCKYNAESWGAFVNLMRRDWFSRRWVVQEIALAKRGTLYCGTKSIDWQDFADAVSLFVHVETATHLLSDVMRKEAVSNYTPGYFEDVHALGAALLVDATRNLFRETETGQRHSLLSLEHLISKYSIFQASEPRDTIYAFLSIAKDTKAQTTQAELSISQDPEIKRIKEGLASFPFARKILIDLARGKSQVEDYEVNYALPVEDVYQSFVDFSVRKSMKSDPTRALDIICRPWAPEPNDHRQDDGSNKALPSWIPDLRKAPHEMSSIGNRLPNMQRNNADTLVGLPTVAERNYSAAGSRTLNLRKWKFKSSDQYHAMLVEGFVFDEIGEISDAASLGNIPREWTKFAKWRRKTDNVPEDLWRTLVADRGPHGQNPPTFYPRACKEALSLVFERKDLDTGQIINHGNCTIVAEFLRRVKAVIWDRRLSRTKYEGHLGLVPKATIVGDLVCILYGCSVPLVFRKKEKTEDDIIDSYKRDMVEKVNLIQRNWRARQELRILLRSLNEQSNPIASLPSPNLVNEELAGSSARSNQPARLRFRILYSLLGISALITVRRGYDQMESITVLICLSLIAIMSSSQPTGQKGAPTPAPRTLTGTRASATSNPAAPRGRRKQSAAMTRTYREPFPPLNSAAWRDYVRANIASDDFELPWSQDGQTFDSRRILETVPEDQRHYYVLIGECYVHRMMDGEAIDWQAKETEDQEAKRRKRQRVFEIR